jgi:ABC-type uncharacterized transport system permease subunit
MIFVSAIAGIIVGWVACLKLNAKITALIASLKAPKP